MKLSLCVLFAHFGGRVPAPIFSDQNNSFKGVTNMTEERRRDLDAALSADGCRLRGNSIVREFSEGPMPMPLAEPVVLVHDVEDDLDATLEQFNSGEIPY